MPRPTARRAPISMRTRISSPMARMSAARAGSCRCAGIPWQATRPPVVLDLWPRGRAARRLLHHHRDLGEQGQEHRLRRRDLCLVEARQFPALPRPAAASRTRCFEMAMLPPDAARSSADVAGAGWRLADPRPISADMARYGDFIRASRGEFTVAKDIYVRPMSGWFSDRSVCYLASGRPVVTMRTGWSRFYPAGEGLFEYSERDGGARRLRRDRRRLSPPQPRRARHRGGIFRQRPRCFGAACGMRLVSRAAARELEATLTAARAAIGAVGRCRAFGGTGWRWRCSSWRRFWWSRRSTSTA